MENPPNPYLDDGNRNLLRKTSGKKIKNKIFQNPVTKLEAGRHNKGTKLAKIKALYQLWGPVATIDMLQQEALEKLEWDVRD